MKIIQATLEHLDDIVPLFDAYRVWYNKSSDLLKARRFLAERLLQSENALFLVYTEGGVAAGFTQLYPMFSSVRMARLWILNDLFVAPTARGNGYSVALIEKAKEFALKTGAAGLVLETDKTNDIGNKLYPRTDFVLDTTGNHYTWDNPNFVI